MRRSEAMLIGRGLLFCLALVCGGILLGMLMSSCALWQLGTPVRPKHLRPCVGTYAYPDSASVCTDTAGGR